MLLKLLMFLLSLIVSLVDAQDLSFSYNGLNSANLTLDGISTFSSNGLLVIINGTEQRVGHAFYPNPITFKSSPNDSAFSFSTTFVFAIVPEYPTLSGHGITFVISPTRGLPGSLPSQFIGLFNKTNNGNHNNHVFSVELDTIYSSEFSDINENHVEIDINGLESISSSLAGYYATPGGEILEARDLTFGTEYIATEVELVLKLGLLCSHSEPAARPSMRQVVQFLEGDVPLLELSSLCISASGLSFENREGFSDLALSYPSSMDKAFSYTTSIAESLLSGGR
ncbi:hypothetical protein K2173_019617 [Erythroxylum novogranatense]|uniref:Legume lectin domain-containing protein n=1 Tax=Erythroxylum novogranatense TaxID=1862640 RepID=A0AAV8UBY9_9ROSI|nr:hypothetical protein K2173_019617 [Erythroxylum novogranatense]